MFNSIEKRSQSEFTSRGLGAIVLAQCADGFRVIARKDGAHVRLYSRPGNDLTSRFPLIVEAVDTTALALRCGQSILRWIAPKIITVTGQMTAGVFAHTGGGDRAPRYTDAASSVSKPGDCAVVERAGTRRQLVMCCPDGCGEILSINLD